MFIFEYRQKLKPGGDLYISDFKEVSIPVYQKLPGFISVGVYKYEPVEQWGQTETEWDYVFVEVWESKEAQEKLNPLKGSICARTDCDYSTFSFPAYFEGSASDFATGRVLPSMAHGSAIHPAWQQQVSNIMTQFASDRDVAAAQAALVLAAEDAGYPQ